MHSYARGVLLCLVATLSWGAMFPVMTGALLRIDPFTFTALRHAVSGASFLAVLLVMEGRGGLSLRGERLLPAWLFGLAGFAGYSFLVFCGQQIAGADGALTASIMMATMPMLGALVNWGVRKVRPPLTSFLFILLSFGGVLLVVTKGDLVSLARAPQNYGADALIVLGALCWVIYTVGASFYPRWSPYKYTAFTTLLGFASVVVIDAGLYVTRVVELPTPETLASILPHLVYMAFGAGLVGVLSWNVGNKILGPLNGVLFMDVVPLTAFAISAFEGVVPGRMQLLGAALTGMALICNNLYLRRVGASLAAPAPQARPANPHPARASAAE